MKRFFDESSDDYLFLVDEAHNLVDRAREMYSAELSKEKIMSVKRAVPKWNTSLIKALEKMNKVFFRVEKKTVKKMDILWIIIHQMPFIHR